MYVYIYICVLKQLFCYSLMIGVIKVPQRSKETGLGMVLSVPNLCYMAPSFDKIIKKEEPVVSKFLSIRHCQFCKCPSGAKT